MAQKLFRSIFFLVLINLLVKPVWIFGIDLHVQNVVGAEDYGLYFIVFNFSFLFHVLLDMGIHQFTNREVAQDRRFLSEQFAKLFAIKGLLAIIYFAVSFALAGILGFSFIQKKLLFFLVINQMLLSLILFSRSNFTAMQWYAWDAFFSVFDRVLSILLCVLLLYTSSFGTFEIMDFVYAQTIALTLGALFSLLVVAWKGEVIFPRLELKSLWPLIYKSLPYALVVLLMTIYTRIDAVMLEALLDDSANLQAGIYAAAYRILDAVNMIPFLLASLLIPYFAKQLKQQADFQDVLWQAVSLMISLAIPFLLLIYFFHAELIDLMYTEGNPSWYPCFQLLMFCFPFVFISYLFGGFLTAAGYLKQISVFAFITIGLNIALNYFLIPDSGALGAAIATIASQALMAIAQLSWVMRHWETDFSWKLLLKTLLYFGILLIVILLLNTFSFTWLLKIAIFALVAILLSVALRLLNIKKLIHL